MSREVCISCKQVVRTTVNQNTVWVIKEHDLEEMDASPAAKKEFSDILYHEFRAASRTACLCDECFDKLI